MNPCSKKEVLLRATIVVLALILTDASSKTAGQPARPEKTPTRVEPAAGEVIGWETNFVSITDASGRLLHREERRTPLVRPEANTTETKLKQTTLAINTGTILLNPYTVSTNGIQGDPSNRRVLERADGTAAKFFIDVSYNRVWAWDTSKRSGFAKNQLSESHPAGAWFWTGMPPLDFQAHVSYYASDDKETTASAIIGSGNFGGEITLGLPIYRALRHYPQTAYAAKDNGESEFYKATESVHWIGLVASYSGVSDSSSFGINSRILGGIGYRSAVKSPIDKDTDAPREIVLTLAAGLAAIDTVRFIDEDSREIAVRHEMIPDYTLKTTAALEADLHFPLTDNTSVITGVRLYPSLNPGMWSAYVGLTVPVDKIAGVFK